MEIHAMCMCMCVYLLNLVEYGQCQKGMAPYEVWAICRGHVFLDSTPRYLITVYYAQCYAFENMPLISIGKKLPNKGKNK